MNFCGQIENTINMTAKLCGKMGKIAWGRAGNGDGDGNGERGTDGGQMRWVWEENLVPCSHLHYISALLLAIRL